MTIINLSKENCTCPEGQIMHKQVSFNSLTLLIPYINFLKIVGWVHFPLIQIELNISTYRIRVFACTVHSNRQPVFLHPIQLRRPLIIELICESVKINAFRNPEST